MKFIILIALLYFSSIFGQNGFQLSQKEQTKIPFEFINNQIIIDLKINQTPLKFIVDTGVEETLIFSLDNKEELQLYDAKPIKFRGLGSDKPIEGIKSENNIVEIGKYFRDEFHTLYIVVDQDIDLTATMGMPINGIIGYHFFKNYAVEINYTAKKIILHQVDSKKLQKRKNKYQKFEIELLKNKPFINTTITFDEDKETGNFLLDTGNSDIIWLFEQSFLNSREKKLYDFLGRGFSGNVNGYRFRTQQVIVNNEKFTSPILVIPDSVSIKNVHYIENRKGSLGSGYISRFDVIFDYPNQTFYSIKTNRITQPFLFNRSGIEVVLGGTFMTSEKINLSASDSYGNKVSGGVVVFDVNAADSKMIEKPIYVIQNVREKSKAENNGIKKGDIIEKINGKLASNYSLSEIISLLQDQNKSLVYLTLKRINKVFEVEVPLEDFL
jgi:hypothetical protein